MEKLEGAKKSMDNYKKLDCVKGLLMGMDRQLQALWDKSIGEEAQNIVIDRYYEAIINFLNEEDTNA